MNSKLQKLLPDHSIPFSFVVILTVVAAIGNYIGAFVVWKIGGESAASFSCGLLLAQPCVLSVWCALVRQRLITRVSFSMGILFVLFSLYMLTLNSLEELPLEVPLICLGIIVVLSVSIQLVLLILRQTTGRALAVDYETETKQADSQFGIKHLLIATTMAAIVIALAQSVFANYQLEGGNPPWWDITVFLISLSILTTIVCLLSTMFVFFDGGRTVFGIFLLIAVFGGPWLVYMALWYYTAGFKSIDAYFNTLFYAFALGATIVSVLAAFFAIGYRWRRTTEA